MSFYENLCFSDRQTVDWAVRVETKGDYNYYYDILEKYCVDNDVEFHNLPEEEIYGAVSTMEDYGSADIEIRPYWFWID